MLAKQFLAHGRGISRGNFPPASVGEPKTERAPNEDDSEVGRTKLQHNWLYLKLKVVAWRARSVYLCVV